MGGGENLKNGHQKDYRPRSGLNWHRFGLKPDVEPAAWRIWGRSWAEIETRSADLKDQVKLGTAIA
jgi:hypothetical protein